MRKVLFVTMALVLLLGTFATAFAQEEFPGVVLGDLAEIEVWGLDAYEAVDVYLYRPPTIAWDPVGEIWVPDYPFAGGPFNGTYFYPTFESEWRRQSYPAYTEADILGYYYAEFMLPRDEAWFPCSYPYKWNCNYARTGYVEFHSPVWQDDFEDGLAWPYFDSIYYDATGDFLGAWLLANPMDTVHPHVIVVDTASSGTVGFEFEVLGYYWKWSDLEDDFEFIPVP